MKLLFPISGSGQALRIDFQHKSKRVIPASQFGLKDINQWNFVPPKLSPAKLNRTATAAPYPVDDCATYTFRLLLGNNTYETSINDIVSTDGLNTYQVGYTTVNGTQDALLQYYDDKGKLSWSKTLGFGTQQESIREIDELPDGNLVMIGTITQGLSQQPFILATDPNGNVLWMKSILTPTPFKGSALVAHRSGAIGIVAQNDSVLLYSRFDYSGNLVWMRTVQPLHQVTTVVGMNADDLYRWFVGYSGIDSSRRVGGVIGIDPVNGNIINAIQVGGPSSNTDFVFHRMQVIGLRPRLFGIYSVNNGPYQLFLLTSNSGATFESLETFQTPGINFDLSASSTLSRWAEALTFKNSAASSDIYVFNSVNGFEYPDTLIHWRKRFTGMNNYIPAVIDRSDDGGYYISSNSSLPNTPTLVLKLDSIGQSPSCPGTDFEIHKTTQYQYPHRTLALISPIVSYAVQPNAYTIQQVVIDTSYQCYQLNCPPEPIEDTCQYTFYRVFRSYDFCDIASSMSVNASNEVLLTAFGRTNPYEPQTGRAALIKFDSLGKLSNRIAINIGDASSFSKHISLADGNYLALGSSAYLNSGYMTLTKFSSTLNVIWNRSFSINGPYSGSYEILEAADGSIFFWYEEGPDPFNQELSLMKLDANGTFLWMKDYRPGNFYYSDIVGDACQDDQYIYTVNKAWAPTQGYMAMKIDKQNGNLVWAKNIGFSGAVRCDFDEMQIIGDRLAFFGYFNSGSQGKTLVTIMDKNGNMIAGKTFTYKGDITSRMMQVTRNKDIVLTGFVYDFSLAPFTGFVSFIRIDSALNVKFSKRVFTNLFGLQKDIEEAVDGGLYETGYLSYNNDYLNDLYLKKYAFDGTMGNCVNENYDFSPGLINFTSTALVMNPTAGIVNLQNLPHSQEDYSLQQNRLICSSPVVCTLPDLAGIDQVCNNQDTIEYRLAKNSGCTAPVSWMIDPTKTQIIYQSDSLIRIKFLSTGTTRITAKIFSGCGWLQDSIDVNVSSSRSTIDLGPDTSLCPGNRITLNARSGFASYLWQDGSTDSVYQVTQPGTYYVAADNGCSITVRDTIIVAPAPAIPFDLGADLSKCNNDSISINAPAGFLNYSWSPAYNITNTSGQSVKVFPARDTMYRVAAEKTPGCFAYDSILVRVNRSAPIHLGIDTSFCNGGLIILNAGPGFQQYQWNTGSTAQQITASNKGIYSVIGTDANNCKSSDTLEVTAVFPNPVVNLSKDSLLCTGDRKILDAGNGFSQYLWQDGSTSSRFTATTTGVYWVQVTDANNCRTTDTSTITRLLLIPEGFLPPDTSICTYGKLTLIPMGNFNSYAWSNSSITRTISVDKAGTYSLTVVDDNGCRGTDAIVVVAKNDCLHGFYVPNAFTPNSDRNNQTFKPLLFGFVKQYRFTIYNRYGQRVFETTELGKGWDGTVAGLQQNSGTFVWACTYQFEGEEIKIEKGTVLLIR